MSKNTTIELFKCSFYNKRNFIFSLETKSTHSDTAKKGPHADLMQ